MQPLFILYLSLSLWSFIRMARLRVSITELDKPPPRVSAMLPAVSGASARRLRLGRLSLVMNV